MAAATKRGHGFQSTKHTGQKQYPRKKNQKFDHKAKFGDRKSKIIELDEDINELQRSYSQIEPSNIKRFTDLPLSSKTQTGLKWAKFEEPTEIQKEAIGLALQGHDLLCAAKTGSGKTLAFLIPILENLYRQKWSRMDGLGALIISPTRELAYQIFEVLRKVGKRHDFSAGLVIGGKHVRDEAERINKTNVVICTPGRLLQHMDETAFFTADNLQMLVLDEADRILDMGFKETMNAIVQNLPETRQTWLFSATQTKSVKDLARLSLKNPIYVSVHEHAEHSTPTSLQQSYIVCDLHEKVNMLWSFIKHHLKSKVIVFMSSCKQVKYIYEAFRRLRPGVTLLCLNGDMKQLKRVAVYEQFCRKNHALLFATDIAARGLDFPAVNWVLQMDCPEDANTYIHRAGRTARYQKDGEALLLLLPSEEEAMLADLMLKKIPINKIKVNPKRQWSIQPKLESQCAADVELKAAAQRAFVSYLRSVFLMPNKKVFDVFKLDTDKYSSSLGLAIAPRIRFLQKEIKRRKESQKITKPIKDGDSASDESESESSSSGDEDTEAGEKKDASSELLMDVLSRTKKSKSRKRTEKHKSDSDSSDEGGAERKASTLRFGVNMDEDEDFLTVKKRHEVKECSDDVAEEDKEDDEDDVIAMLDDEGSKKKKEKQLTKFALAKKLKKKNIQINTKVKFDESGEVIEDPSKSIRLAAEGSDEGSDDEAGGINIQKARQRMREIDQHDKKLYQQRIRMKHREERLKKKEKTRPKKAEEIDDEEEFEVTLGGVDDEMEDNEQRNASDQEYYSDSDNSFKTDSQPPRKKLRTQDSEVDLSEDNADESNDDEEDDDENEDEEPQNTPSMSLADDEELAMKLLNG